MGILIAHTSSVSALIPFVVGLYAYRQLEKAMRILVILLCMTTLVEITSVILAIRSINNLFLFHLYLPIEYCFFSLIFRSWIKNNNVRKQLLISIPVMIILFFVFDIYVEGIKQFNSYIKTIECVLLIGISAYFLILLLHRRELHPIYKDHRFYVAVAVLVSSGVPLFVNASFNHLLITNVDILKPLLTFNSIAGIIVYMLFAVAFLSARGKSYDMLQFTKKIKHA